MSDIKVFYTKFVGLIIGETSESQGSEGTVWTIKNPNAIVFTDEAVGMQPIHQIVKEDSITLTSDDLNFGGAYTPDDSIVQGYRSMYSSLVLPNGV